MTARWMLPALITIAYLGAGVGLAWLLLRAFRQRCPACHTNDTVLIDEYGGVDTFECRGCGYVFDLPSEPESHD